jgi:hypothetical protein
MNTANLLRLVLLAAIWGGSFLSMRISRKPGSEHGFRAIFPENRALTPVFVQ